SPQGATARREALRGILWESVTYLPALPARKRRQRIDDGTDSVFWREGCGYCAYLSPRWARRRPQAGRLSPALAAHLASVDARRGCRVVLVVTPRRMMEMDDEVAIA